MENLRENDRLCHCRDRSARGISGTDTDRVHVFALASGVGAAKRRLHHKTTMNTNTPNSFFVTGGTLGYDAPSYVERGADRELYSGLANGEFCYVLTSRQM